MKPIGGYFGLETGVGCLPPASAIPVNFGRGGLEVILCSRGYRHVYLPDYLCPDVFAFLKAIAMPYTTYGIDAELEPVAIPKLDRDEAFLYVNYFGVKDAYCLCLEQSQPNLILDLSQAFHYRPRRADGFNSARKFFGVPDGAFVFGKDLTDVALPESHSFDQCEALLRRADGDLAGGYAAFHRLEQAKGGQRAAKMSLLTRSLLGSIDVNRAQAARLKNFLTLHQLLGHANVLAVDTDVAGPLCYPFLDSNGALLKQRLIEKHVFVPTYWRGLDAFTSPNTFVDDLTRNLVCLPCDQRYSPSDMADIAKLIA